MAGDKPRRKIGRGYARDLDAGTFRPMIDSFELHLRAQHKSEKTVRIYLEAALWLAAARRGWQRGRRYALAALACLCLIPNPALLRHWTPLPLQPFFEPRRKTMQPCSRE